MPPETDQQKAVIQDRRSARYKLAKLLTDEQFAEAARLAKEWYRQGVIQIEDRTFVEEIVRAAMEC